jgi:hypothetical protein
MELLDGELLVMVLSVHLQRSAVAEIANFPVRGQFIRSRSLKPVVSHSIWLFQESPITHDYCRKPHPQPQPQIELIMKVRLRYP